jgi:hypothetical protein
LATAAVVPVFGPSPRAARDFQVEKYGSGVRITLGGSTLFEVSAQLFDGQSAVSCDHDDNDLHIAVRGGWFPGTDIPADLDVTARRNGPGWDGSFTIQALGFDCRFPFERWLLGHPEARGTLALQPLMTTVTSAALARRWQRSVGTALSELDIRRRWASPRRAHHRRRHDHQHTNSGGIAGTVGVVDRLDEASSAANAPVVQRRDFGNEAGASRGSYCFLCTGAGGCRDRVTS